MPAFRVSRFKRSGRAAVLACLVMFPAAAWAQPAPGGAELDGERPGGHGRGRHRASGGQPATPALPRLTPKPDPRLRLDAGALLCRSEAGLQQHQAAVTAALDGRTGGEPSGCRFVTAMTAVAILDRHGPARTEVRLPGPPEQVGWTNAIVREDPAGPR